ncbi:PREDICTED: nuclear factor interleukin-3-regulated protein-like [Nanorana parkeri]|uniref:nuclear factor interleukin-3-regulated protein-like n=1 Tax=Nanorana parkeri TaxID=125878 RepID=UPI0008544E10|nr:PREDICTED: nuclear factor interleukin-3-regulated protein-like [Nanorana parkeri]
MESPLSNYSQSMDEQHSQERAAGGSGAGRRKREFISDERKDASYWEKRRKNNEAAKRSREKRRFHDLVLEGRVAALDEENGRLRNELFQLKLRYGLISAASFIEASQGLGNRKAADGGPLLCNSRNTTYMSPYLAINSDSSEADSGGGAAMDSYSPRSSLSDLSDQSSRDSPVPAGYGEGRTTENDFANMCPVENNPSTRGAVPRGGVILYRVGGLTVDPQHRHIVGTDMESLQHQASEYSAPLPRSSIFVHSDSFQNTYQDMEKAPGIKASTELLSPKSPQSEYQSEDSGSDEGGSNCCPLEWPTYQEPVAGVKLPHKLRLKCRTHGHEGWGADKGQGIEVQN